MEQVKQAIKDYLIKYNANHLGDTSLFNSRVRASVTKIVRAYGYKDWYIAYSLGDAEIEEIIANIEIH